YFWMWSGDFSGRSGASRNRRPRTSQGRAAAPAVRIRTRFTDESATRKHQSRPGTNADAGSAAATVAERSRAFAALAGALHGAGTRPSLAALAVGRRSGHQHDVFRDSLAG